MPAMNWKPQITISHLKARAEFLQKIRTFFDSRGYYEVDTPIISQGVSLDPHISSMQIQGEQRFLQTSPEFAMKRLVAAGSGPIFQMGKVFRQSEQGRKHNPEFTMLEWYRPEVNLAQFMLEVDALLQNLLYTKPSQVITYQTLFEEFCQFNPHTASLSRIIEVAKSRPDAPHTEELDRDDWLGFIQSSLIEPNIAKDAPVFVTEFPLSQCALAKIIPGDPPRSARFEVFYQGFEIANGYDELNNAAEQLQRFLKDNQKRESLGFPTLPIDQRFLNAVDHLPNCCGVAMGVDRLLQILLNQDSIANVIPFAWDQA